MRGQLLGIATRAAPRSGMEEVARARITIGLGVDRDSRGKPGRRQVTVLTCGAWREACADIGEQLAWTVRRANLLVDGIELRGRVGYDLRIGDAVLTITGETRPCKRMDEARMGLRAALDPAWRGGVTCTVVCSGSVCVGDEVILSRSLPRQIVLAAHARARTLYRRGRTFAGTARGWLRELRGM